MNTSNLTPVIGMEIHVELRTQSKMFCGCPATHFGVEPNTHTCPVCLGMPGALPVPNKQAIDWTVLIGLAIKCQIATESKFDRKNYFYPDLPKGYQISQYDEPFCFKGIVSTSYGDVGITRVHLEEDTAKLQHTLLDGKPVTLVDFNRSSVPLVEIVTEPDITSAKQAKEYAQKIQRIIRYLEVSDADMEKGSMRVEANISWGLNLGYKVEVKNINSFRFLEKAIDYELNRQKELLAAGITPDQETRGWNEAKNCTVTQRSKEDAKDYRYFPEPDIPPIRLSTETVESIRQNMPQLPEELKHQLIESWHIRPDFVDILIEDKARVSLAIRCFEMGKLKNLTAADIAKYLINKNIPSNTDPKQIIDTLIAQYQKPEASNEDVEKWITETITNNPDVVEKYKSGKIAVIGVLVGDVMKRSKGQADPKTVSEVLKEKLAN